MLLLKLGGAVIAPKDKEKFFDQDYLLKFSRFLEEIVDESCILLHGTGSFGHGFVKKYGLTLENQHLLRQDLDKYFFEIDKSFPHHERFRAEEVLSGVVSCEGNARVIVGGDIDKQANIISSDDLFAYFLDRYDPEVSFLLTDVAGVWDAEGELIPLIIAESIDHLHFWTKSGDVTGSMAQKIKKLFDYKKSHSSKSVWIIDARDFSNWRRILQTGDGVGTKVVV